VVKHALFALAIEHLRQKPTPFRIIDTHAGRCLYRLDAAEATKTQEWRAGIGRLLGGEAKPLPPELEPLLAGYLAVVRQHNQAGDLARYPGSPAIAQSLMRPQDTLLLNEAHPEELQQLRSGLRRRGKVKVLGLDAWLALRAVLPPPERRGVILIDPAFEAEGELERLAEAIAAGLQRFASGVFLAWYPIKEARTTARFNKAVTSRVAGKLLSLEVLIQQPSNRQRLNGCGLLIANPPFTFAGILNSAGPALARLLAVGPGANCSVRWLKAL
jgi:23S rRNA (adenine2030-N6)-methyltransferase